MQSAALQLQGQFAANSPPVLAARNSLEQAFRALRIRLARPPGTAPNSEQIANHIGLLIANLRNIPPFGGAPGNPAALPPQPPAPPNLGYDPGLALSFLNSTLANTALLLRSMGGQTFIFLGLRRDVEGLAQQLEAVRIQVQRGDPLPAVQRTFYGVQRFSDSITNRMRHPTVPTYWQQVWVNIGAGLARTAETFQLGGAPQAQPGLPPPIPGFPVANLISAIDSLTGELDAYLASIGPLMAFNPQYFPMQALLNSMRGSVMEMRQSIAAGNPPPDYRPQFVEAQQAYNQLANLYNAIVAANPTSPPPTLDPISFRFNELAKAMPHDPAPPDGPGAFSSS